MNNTNRRLLWAVAISLMLLSAPAHAQQFMQGALSWIQGNALTTLGTLAIIAAGGMLLAMRANFIAIVCVVAGIWIMFNAANIITYFQT